MDNENLVRLERLRPDEARSHLGLMLEFAEHHKEWEVPDPYYGGKDGSSVCWTWWKMRRKGCCNISGSSIFSELCQNVCPSSRYPLVPPGSSSPCAMPSRNGRGMR